MNVIEHHLKETNKKLIQTPFKQNNKLKDQLLIQSEPTNHLNLSINTQKKEIRPSHQKNIILQLESYPSESLVKILAKLFDRITRVNDHPNHSGSPATPSSELEKPIYNHLGNQTLLQSEFNFNSSKSSSHPSNPILTQNFNIRPVQSPTVLQFQNLDFHHHSDQLGNLNSKIQSTSNQINHHFISNQDNSEELTTASKKILSDPASILTFHAKIVPQISIEAYLLRILKYCPTPNGVFLSSLIYLDRLSKISFFNHNQSLNNQDYHYKKNLYSNCSSSFKNQNSQSFLNSTLNNSNDDIKIPSSDFRFLVDSWNIHRFLIASITIASKLFSDVFYTNSRYAKVGGLPLEELEELEMKFLLMSDFRLMIGTEEFASYGTKLLSQELLNESLIPSEQVTKKESIVGMTGFKKDDEDEDEERMVDVHIVESSNSSGFQSSKIGDQLSRSNLVEDSDSDSDSDKYDQTVERMSTSHLPTNQPINTNSTAWRSYHDILSPSSSSSSSSSSSCNSSERSSCSTVTPHSPTRVMVAINPPLPTSTIA